MNEIEERIVRKLVELLIAAGYKLSVWDGEGYAITGSGSVDDTLAAMGHTGEDTLQVSRPWQQDAYSADLGDIYLVYGNDGHDVIADDNVEPMLNRILDEVESFADALAQEHGHA